jgi:hypothetical protein
MEAAMKTALVTLALLGAMFAHARADPIDVALKDRDAMVAAVALLLSLPTKCNINNKKPSGDEIVAFVTSYGHKDDDAFAAEVEARIKKNVEGLKDIPDSKKQSYAEMVCGYGILLSIKVRHQ